jgi:hypothetical protein
LNWNGYFGVIFSDPSTFPRYRTDNDVESEDFSQLALTEGEDENEEICTSDLVTEMYIPFSLLARS